MTLRSLGSSLDMWENSGQVGEYIISRSNTVIGCTHHIIYIYISYFIYLSIAFILLSIHLLMYLSI